MSNMSDKKEMMTKAALDAMRFVIALQPGEQVLVVTDERRKSIGNAFHRAALKGEAGAEIFVLPESMRPLKELPGGMAGMLEGKHVVINAFYGLAEETPFRIKWIRAVTGGKARRLGHAPGITEEMMTEGPMNVDYEEMVSSVERMLAALQGTKTCRVTTPGGTDLSMDIEGRGFTTDVRITNEHWGNLPAGEVWCAPREENADGVVVCDGSIGDLGAVSAPLNIFVEKGTIVRFESDDGELVEKVEALSSVDDMARVIGELGIGLNPGARLTGNLLEDEKAFRTMHVAFGNNVDMDGGMNTSETHRDYLFRDPTFTVTYLDGSSRILIEEGELKV